MRAISRIAIPVLLALILSCGGSPRKGEDTTKPENGQSQQTNRRANGTGETTSLTINNKTTRDIYGVQWGWQAVDGSEGIKFGKDRVLAAIWGVHRTGIRSGGSATHRVPVGSKRIYFYYADEGTARRTLQTVTVDRGARVEFNLAHDTKTELVGSSQR